MNSKLKYQKGFSIIQVVIASSILSVLALTTAQLISQSMAGIGYIEDRASHLELKTNINSLLKNSDVCSQSLSTKNLTRSGATDFTIINDAGDIVFDPNDSSKNTFDRLNISRIYIEDEDVFTNGGSGKAKISVEVVRDRKIGVRELSTITTDVVIDIDPSTNLITSCTTDTQDEPSCYEHHPSIVHSGGDGETKVLSPDVKAVTITVGSTSPTTWSRGGGENSDQGVCAANGHTFTFYPGRTKVGNKVLGVGKALSSFGGRYGFDDRWVYDGVTLAYNERYNSRCIRWIPSPNVIYNDVIHAQGSGSCSATRDPANARPPVPLPIIRVAPNGIARIYVSGD